MRTGDASFTWSFDPCTLILTILQGVSRGGEALPLASRLGKLTLVRETITGVSRSERSAARCGSPLPQGRGVIRQKRKEVEASVPARNQRVQVGLPARCRKQLQKSVGDVWSRISSANALQKGRSGSSERGPSSERRSAGDTVGRRIGRKVQSQVDLTAKAGEDRHETQGGERSPFSGSRIAKSGECVAGPGL